MRRAILAFALSATVFGIAGNGWANDVDLASAEKAVFAGGCFWSMQPPFATDGDGKLQIGEYRDQVPDGATGLHRVRAIVEKA
jgi:hypothetical protein